MSSRQEAKSRLSAAAKRRLAMQHESGAWGQRAGSERGNTIATAETLALLARVGTAAGHGAVTRGQEYLARSAIDHARDVGEGGRGPYLRYVVHALSGLYEFGPPTSKEMRRASEDQLAWLLERQVMGGWPEVPGDAISMLSTTQALRALRRVGAPQEAIEAAAGYLLQVRAPGGYWQLEEFGPASSALTAEAVLALHGLDPAIEDEIAVAREWLDLNRRLWLRQVERQPIPGTIWEHPSFALAERALADGGHASFRVGASLDYVEELWDPDEKGWRFPGEIVASIKGASAALLCFDAVLRATPPDLAAATLVSGGRSALSAAVEDGWRITLRERPDVVVDVVGSSDLVSLRPRLWDLLDALALESERAEGGFLYRERVGAAVGMGVRGTLSKEVTRLQERLAAATGGLLNEVVSPAGRGRWRLRGVIIREAAEEPAGSVSPSHAARNAEGD